MENIKIDKDYRKYIKLGINHHLLFPRVFDDDIFHEKTLPILIKRTDFEIVDLFLVENEEIKNREIKFLKECDKEFVYNLPLFFESKDGLNPNSLDAGTRKKTLESAKKHIENAVKIGAEKILMASGEDPGEEKRTRAIEAFAEYVVSFCRIASDFNIDVLIEPFGRTPDKNMLVGSIRETVELIEMVHRQGTKNFWILVDMGHLPWMGDSFESAFSLSVPYLKHVHLGNCVKSNSSSPYYGDKHPPFGIEGGENDVKELAQFLYFAWKSGYIGKDKRSSMTFEMRPYPGKTEEESIEIFKDKLAEAWGKRCSEL